MHMINEDLSYNAYSNLFREREYLVSAGISFVFFLTSLCVSFYAVQFAARDAGNSTSDIVLDNLPVLNTDIIFSEGALILIIFVTVLLFLKPRTIPFVLRSLALLIWTRSFFVIMTHLAPYPDHIITDFGQLTYLSSGFDLFFSGHTAIPFMLALIFWSIPKLRLFFIISSIIAGSAVLLGHLHYTIDVFAAYFITYGVYHFARFIFKKEYRIFNNAISSSDGIYT